AETLALKIELGADETLQLRVNGASGPPVFELSRNGDKAKLRNAPPPGEEMKVTRMQPNKDAKCSGSSSHFLYYYNLFHGPHYDIYNKANGLVSINQYPRTSTSHDMKILMFTVPHQACGIVFLGVSSGPL